MIKISPNPIIGRIDQRKYSSTIIITNYEKCPVKFLEFISKLSFVINTTSWYPDLVCVISNDNLDDFVFELAKISDFCRIDR